MNLLKVIGTIATGLLIVLSGWAWTGHGPSTYKFAPFFLGVFLWLVYLARRSLALQPLHYALFASALLVHDLGTFGFYTRYFFNLHFDTYVHFYFGIAGAALIAQALRARFSLHGWPLWIGSILLILGIGVIHELIECASTIALGPEKGMLKLNDPNPFDTQKDLMNNMLGGILAMALFFRTKQVLPRSTETERLNATPAELSID